MTRHKRPEAPPPPDDRKMSGADPIRMAMDRAPEVEWLTPEQRAESDEALERLRSGRARLIRHADRAAALEEIARLVDGGATTRSAPG